jgi:hypothetical protein
MEASHGCTRDALCYSAWLTIGAIPLTIGVGIDAMTRARHGRVGIPVAFAGARMLATMASTFVFGVMLLGAWDAWLVGIVDPIRPTQRPCSAMRSAAIHSGEPEQRSAS